MDDKERYFWDLTGYLVVRNVLSPEELKVANDAVEHFEDRFHESDVLAGRDSKALQGSSRPTLSGLLEFEKPWCEPFRNMVAHPALVLRLNVMCGPGFRLDHGPLLIGGIKGTQGTTLHGAGQPHWPHVAYHHQNGRMYVGGVTVSWQLTDVNDGDGGFACVPGSHKSRYRMPSGVRTCDEDMGVVVQPAMKAGDVLFFMDGAQTHGALPWTSEQPRRSILFKYAARNAARGGPSASFGSPDIYWEEQIVEGMTEEQLAVMWGPFSNHAGRVPSLMVDEEGTVRVERD